MGRILLRSSFFVRLLRLVLVASLTPQLVYSGGAGVGDAPISARSSRSKLKVSESGSCPRALLDGPLNLGNREFYDYLATHEGGMEHLVDRAMMLGMWYYDEACVFHCPDLDILKPILLDKSSSDKPRKRVLVIGGGFGREIEWFKSHAESMGTSFPKTDLVVLEHSTGLSRHLERVYMPDRELRNLKIEIRNISVLDVTAEQLNLDEREKFDVVLWLWSGIFEFSSKEVKEAFAHLRPLLSSSGVVVVDTITGETLRKLRTASLNYKHYTFFVGPASLTMALHVRRSLEGRALGQGFSLAEPVLNYVTRAPGLKDNSLRERNLLFFKPAK